MACICFVEETSFKRVDSLASAFHYEAVVDGGKFDRTRDGSNCSRGMGWVYLWLWLTKEMIDACMKYT